MAAKKTAAKRKKKVAKKVKRATKTAPKKASPKKAAPKAPSKKSKRADLVALMGQLNEMYGNVIAFADDVPNTYHLRRPSGIMQLDIDTGGGLPAGGMSYVSGPDQAGKTYLIMLYIAMHQRLYGDDSMIAYAHVEGGFDFKIAAMAGVKVALPEPMIAELIEIRRLRGQEGFTPEELSNLREKVGEIILIQGNSGEETLQGVLESVRKKIFGIVALDSISILMTEDEGEKDIAGEKKENVRSQASLVTRFVKMYNPLTKTIGGRNFTTFIVSSQVRADQERANRPAPIARRMRAYKPAGAYAAKHAKLIDVMVTPGDKIRRTIKGKEFVAGKVLKWDLLKGKTGTHDNIRGEAPFIYPEFGTSGVNLHQSVIITGARQGVLIEAEDGQVLLHRINGEVEVISPTMKMLPDLMAADFEFDLHIRREILAAAGVDCLYR
jgi:RecA/RadA recombinase